MAIRGGSELITVIKRKRPFSLAVSYALLVLCLSFLLGMLLYDLIVEGLHESQVIEFDVFHPIVESAGAALFALPIAAILLYSRRIWRDDRLEFRDDQIVSIIRGKPHVIQYGELRAIRYNPRVSVVFEADSGKRVSLRYSTFPVEQIVLELPDGALLSVARRLERAIRRGDIVELRVNTCLPTLQLAFSVLCIAGGLLVAYSTVCRILENGALDFRSSGAVKLLILMVIALVAIRSRYRVARGRGIVLSRQGVRRIGEPIQNEIPWSAIDDITDVGGAWVFNSQGAYPALQVSMAADNALVLPYLYYAAADDWREEA